MHPARPGVPVPRGRADERGPPGEGVMTGETRAEQIARAIRETAGLDVVVEEQDGRIILEGVVDSERGRQAAEDVAADLSDGAEIDNALDVGDTLPTSVDDFEDIEPTAELVEERSEVVEDGGELNPDFTDQPLEDLWETSDPVTGSGDDLEDDDGNFAFVPPVDPVTTTDAYGQAVILGGFETASTDDIEVEASAEDRLLGDEAIADAVRRELRKDAATTDLDVRVVV